MEPIRLIRDLNELRGTCYFEFLPGEFKQHCWNDGSVFLAEETFGFIEPIIVRHERKFDHYAFVGIRRHAWEQISADLAALANRCDRATSIGDLADDVGFFFTTTEQEFAADFQASVADLSRLSSELANWLRSTLQEHECISILGM